MIVFRYIGPDQFGLSLLFTSFDVINISLLVREHKGCINNYCESACMQHCECRCIHRATLNLIGAGDNQFQNISRFPALVKIKHCSATIPMM